VLFGKIVVPRAAHLELHHSILSEAAASRLVLFTAPAGYLCTDSLSAVLKQHRRPRLWLRLGPEDADPAAFLVSFAASAQELCPTVGLATLEQMQRQPGPTAGWPPLFACLGRELALGRPDSAAIVLEHLHRLSDSQPALELLGTHLLPALPPNLARASQIAYVN